jgi:tetratricopeptide (TPR) repeat protein
MAATFGANPAGQEDTEYQQALHYFHHGQWTEAIAAFEALRSRYPSDPRIERMLNDARFKASLDATTVVREKRVIVPWRPIAMRILTITAVLALVVVGFAVVRWRVLPMLAAAQVERQQTIMLTEAANLHASGDLSAAETKYQAILKQFPNNATATSALAVIADEKHTFDLYNQAVVAESNGEDATALQLYNGLQLKSPGYRDISSRITAITHRGDLSKLYERSLTLKALGLEQEAIAALKQIQALDVNYQKQEVSKLLNSLNLKQGQRIIEMSPPEPARVSEALDYFNAALEQKPNDAIALTEARLAVNFIAGRDAYQTQNWSDAAARLGSVYDARPGYLEGSVASMFYNALLNLGDQLFPSDLLAAYQQYSQACNLPVPDAVTACAKASSVIPLLTPTPTPTLTPTPAPTPTAGPTAPPPPATPTPTPQPLEMFRGKIIFKSDQTDQPGYYLMNPDGTNREYLGTYDEYTSLFDALRETERFSPDKNYWVSTGKVDGSPQIILHLPPDPRWGQLPPRPMTRLTGMAYDPVWAPDGSWVAFVSVEIGSDDIWIIRPDGSAQEALSPNVWEWDKHPSWSADSQRITFFSNRAGGTTQIYVMSAGGQNVKNISNNEWVEYDPIWIK